MSKMMLKATLKFPACISSISDKNYPCSNIVFEEILLLFMLVQVIIDEDLSWKPHIHNQCSKIAHGNWALTNLRTYVNLSTLKCAYYGLIYPHLQYCSSLWGQASKTSLKPVQTLQNKALKIMTNTRWHHSASPLYQTLQLLKFNDIVKLQLAKIMHCVHNNNISNLYFGFSKVEKYHHYCTRTSTI